MRSYLFFSALLFVVLLTMSVAFYQSNRSFLLGYIREINAKQVEAYAQILDAIFFRISYASAVIAERGRVQSYVQGRDPERPTASEVEETMVELLQLFTRANTEITSIYVYSMSRDRIVTDRLAAPTGRFHDLGWRHLLEVAEPARPLLVYREDPVFGTPMMTLLRRLDEGDRLTGAVLVNTDIDHARRLLGRHWRSADEGLYVIQGGDLIMLSRDDDELGVRISERSIPGQAGVLLEDSGTPFAARASGTLFNLEYRYFGGAALFEEKMRQLRWYLTILIFSLLVLGSSLTVLLAGFAYRPIRRIVHTIQHIGGWDRAQQTSRTWSGQGDEIRFIEDWIIQAMASNRRLEERLAERFRSLSRAHFTALQLQINPHFLYNTLESLYWNCLEVFRQDDPVPRSVLSLSRFLRTVIATETIVVPLAEEVELTEQYLTLLRLRYEDRLAVRWHVPGELHSATVPKLILQPLVENAFYHGIKPLRRTGTVAISVRRVQHAIEIVVADDGCGMSPERLAEVKAMIGQPIDLAEDHIGLLNVTQRMRILYGQFAGIEIESEYGCGTTVRMSIPDGGASPNRTSFSP